ncbi:hypothetical protein GCM10011396_09470 [Undibacterium terreum]|uniref:Uncharacterized protein n=2 Tax=Undibacterium terreum TaxID=1224302 RepID=A0A916U8W9_9BURK|nr:hypothetical protein GCM10011396_09470 [Undibacterium terreum]
MKKLWPFLAVICSLAHAPLIAAEADPTPANSQNQATAPAPKTHASKVAASSKKEKVALKEVRLLSSEQEVAAATTVPVLSAFIKSVEDKTRKVFSASTHPSELMLQFECAPDSQDMKIAVQGEPEKKLVLKLHDALSHMDKLQVTGKPISFQVYMTVAP